MWVSTRAASRASDFTTKTCKYERLVQSTGNDRNDEEADDINCADKLNLNGSFTSISVTDSPSSAQLDCWYHTALNLQKYSSRKSKITRYNSSIMNYYIFFFTH